MAKRKMNVNSLKNLKTLDTRTEEERKEIAKKGAEATNKKIKERKMLKDLLEAGLLIQDEKTGEQNDVAMTLALIEKAKNGDVSAYTTIRDTLGEKPADKQVVAGNLGIHKVFITQEEKQATDKHIDDFINHGASK